MNCFGACYATHAEQSSEGLISDSQATVFSLWVVHLGKGWLKEIFHLTSPLQLTLYDYFPAQLLNFFVVESQL
jgi:hypothetical protein